MGSQLINKIKMINTKTMFDFKKFVAVISSSYR